MRIPIIVIFFIHNNNSAQYFNIFCIDQFFYFIATLLPCLQIVSFALTELSFPDSAMLRIHVLQGFYVMDLKSIFPFRGGLIEGLIWIIKKYNAAK